VIAHDLAARHLALMDQPDFPVVPSRLSCDNGSMMETVTELTLAQIWNAQWLRDQLQTTSGHPLRVVYRGVWTHGIGPDFTGAYLDIDGRLVEGAIELHLRSSNWLAHAHHLDPYYDTVILHAVLDDDLGRPVHRRDGRSVPTLVLRPFLPGRVEDFPADPRLRPLGAIGFDHCAPSVAANQPRALQRVWEAAGDARLTSKVAAVDGRLARETPAQVLYSLLLDALGYSRNRDGMREIAARLPYDHLEIRLAGRQPSERWSPAAGLLLGTGGFLPLAPREAEAAALTASDASGIEEAWRLHGTAWHGMTLPANAWNLARTRPANHPLRRLLALAKLLSHLDVGLVEDLCALLKLPDPHRALLDWLTTGNPYLGAALAHEMIVNVVVPFTLSYAIWAEQDDLLTAAGQLWDRLPAGRGNAVIRRTVEQICGPQQVPVRTARAEQGLLHIQRTGCAPMRCYECPVALLALKYEAETKPSLPG
jgi:hypothetical protein